MLRILILEDNGDDAELMERELRAAGLQFEAVHVGTGNEFITVLQSFRPDLVLSDYALSDINGLEALKHLQIEGWDIPFILVSGAIGEEVAAEVVKLGAADYVMKTKMPRLREVVKATLENAQRQEALRDGRAQALARIQDERKTADEAVEGAIRILMLEDNADEATLIEKALRVSFRKVILKVVDTEEDFRRELPVFHPTIILADFSLPSFDGLSALRIREEICPDTPFLFVSSVMGEDVAIESMKLGVTDYVMKDKLSRLGHSVRRALNEMRERALRKHAEQALAERVIHLERLTEELIAARNTAQRALVVKSQFLANISHEIRTPMSGILGMAELLTLCHLEPEPRQMADHIYQSADKMLSIVNDILDFSKLEAGKIRLEKRSFSIPQLVEQVTHSIRPAASQKNVSIHLKLDDKLPKLLMGDEGRIRQILLNLAHNAVKFTEKGAIAISAAVIERRGDSCTIKFSVADTGIGIAEKSMDGLFLPFTQVDSSTTRRYGGTGLGLSICKNLTVLMSGDIGVESTLGKGSTFWFELALNLPQDGRSKTAAKPFKRSAFDSASENHACEH